MLVLAPALLFAACDPAKQLMVRNDTAAPVVLILEPHGRDGVQRMELAPGEERNILYGFGGWERPSAMHDGTGRMVGVAFENDRDVLAVRCERSTGTLKIKRRYLLNNGLVVRVK
jgi:hypothetical protein